MQANEYTLSLTFTVSCDDDEAKEFIRQIVEHIDEREELCETLAVLADSDADINDVSDMFVDINATLYGPVTAYI